MRSAFTELRATRGEQKDRSSWTKEVLVAVSNLHVYWLLDHCCENDRPEERIAYSHFMLEREGVPPSTHSDIDIHVAFDGPSTLFEQANVSAQKLSLPPPASISSILRDVSSMHYSIILDHPCCIV